HIDLLFGEDLQRTLRTPGGQCTKSLRAQELRHGIANAWLVIDDPRERWRHLPSFHRNKPVLSLPSSAAGCWVAGEAASTCSRAALEGFDGRSAQRQLRRASAPAACQPESLLVARCEDAFDGRQQRFEI